MNTLTSPKCPNCDHVLCFPPEYYGHKVECIHCKHRFQLPPVEPPPINAPRSETNHFSIGRAGTIKEIVAFTVARLRTLKDQCIASLQPVLQRALLKIASGSSRLTRPESRRLDKLVPISFGVLMLIFALLIIFTRDVWQSRSSIPNPEYSSATTVSPAPGSKHWEAPTSAATIQAQNQVNAAKYEDAIAICSEVLQKNPKDYWARRIRGAAYVRKGMYDEAILDLTESIAQYPQAHATPYRNRGFAYLNCRRFDDAIQDLTQAIQLDPTSADTYRLRADAYNMKGVLDNAITDATEAISLDPKSALAYGIRGAAYLTKRDTEKAISDLQTALAIEPSNTWIKERFAEAQRFRQQLETYRIQQMAEETAATARRLEAENQRLKQQLDEAQRVAQQSAQGTRTDSSTQTGPGAYVQHYTHRRASEYRLTLEYSYMEFNAQVKIVRTGTYTVRAGYWKDGDWHTGGITGKKYYAETSVRGEAGDTVVAIIRLDDKPPWNNTVHCAVPQ
jgi:tetratricopeptide (TPR) repeat protein